VGIIGGDGTMRHSLPELLRAQVPAYHIPLGTENLFSRAMGTHFGTDYMSNVHQLAAWAQARRPQRVDLLTMHTPMRADAIGLAAIMISVGPDASIVHRLAIVRTGAITHFSYTRPILAEALAPYLPHLTITLDGKPFVDNQRGWLLIANMPTYARRLNPCRNASPSDGLLDVAFFPATSTIGMLHWLARCALRQQLEADSAMRGAIVSRAHSVSVASWSAPLKMQADGDQLSLPTGTMRLEVSVRPGALPVLAGMRIGLIIKAEKIA
jgi:diacylglycerol kinase family enzyme